MTSADFFAYARERHNVYLRRAGGTPPPWTDDPVLQAYRFTNVFRELDAVTIWFRENVRDKLRHHEDVMLATVLFRWFNRVSTGEAIFCQNNMVERRTAWEMRGAQPLTKADARGWCGQLRASIRAYCGGGPYVTGSYIIKGTDGMDKLDGVLDSFRQFMTETRPTNIVPAKVQCQWYNVACEMLARRNARPVTLEQTWEWLKEYPYLGPFTAYEVVTDLRHTALLDNAPDINTWANPGPGAMRGLARIHGRFVPKREGSTRLAAEARVPREQMMQEMRELLQESRDAQRWPRDWPRWEMREVEHTLCEFDKYERARTGVGRPRQVFRSV